MRRKSPRAGLPPANGGRSALQKNEAEFLPVSNYEREFEVRARPERVLLHFGAVDHAARVWINQNPAVTPSQGVLVQAWADR